MGQVTVQNIVKSTDEDEYDDAQLFATEFSRQVDALQDSELN